MRDRAYKLGALGTQAVFPGGFAVICSAQALLSLPCQCGGNRWFGSLDLSGVPSSCLTCWPIAPGEGNKLIWHRAWQRERSPCPGNRSRGYVGLTCFPRDWDSAYTRKTGTPGASRSHHCPAQSLLPRRKILEQVCAEKGPAAGRRDSGVFWLAGPRRLALGAEPG